MCENNVYKLYREENDQIIIDLTVTQVLDEYEIVEKVNNIHILNIVKSNLNTELNNTNIPMNVRIEIERAISKNPQKTGEYVKYCAEKMLPILKENSEYVLIIVIFILIIFL